MGERSTEGHGMQVLGVTETAPDFDVPAGACDCHVHVFGPPDSFPFSPDRVYTPGLALVDDLLALQRALRLDRVVIVQPSPYGTDNSCTLDALRQLGPRARGVAVIDSATTDAALAEMHVAGVRGVRLNLETLGQNDPVAAASQLRWAAARMAPLGWHVQTYTNLSMLTALHDTILELPTTLVVDHFGRTPAAPGLEQPGLKQLLDLLRSGKVYIKLSAPYQISQMDDYADAKAIVEAMVAANPDRVLWATNWPHPMGGGARPRRREGIEPFRAEDDGRALNRIARWVPDPDRLRKLLVENPARLYWSD